MSDQFSRLFWITSAGSRAAQPASATGPSRCDGPITTSAAGVAPALNGPAAACSTASPTPDWASHSLFRYPIDSPKAGSSTTSTRSVAPAGGPLRAGCSDARSGQPVEINVKTPKQKNRIQLLIESPIVIRPGRWLGMPWVADILHFRGV